MVLRMAQPWPHAKTDVFWFRRAVPASLRNAVGKREELVSLGTKDVKLARVKYGPALSRRGRYPPELGKKLP